MTEEDLNPYPLEKKYIEVLYDGPTQARLAAYCVEHGFDCTQTHSGRKVAPEDFGFHTTVWFTTTEHQIPNQSRATRPFTVTPTGFELFGEDQNTLVLLVEGGSYVDRKMPDDYDALMNIRNSFGRTHGMDDQWPAFRPHISLSYVHEGDVLDVPLPDFPLVVNHLNVKPQKK
jgi:hypothetical protein